MNYGNEIHRIEGRNNTIMLPKRKYMKYRNSLSCGKASDGKNNVEVQS